MSGSSLREAQAKLERASEGVRMCRDAVSTIASDLQKARAELDGFSALPRLTAPQLLAIENTRRLVLKLEAEGKAAEAAVEQAEGRVQGATSAEVASMHVSISGGKITEYRTTLRVSFGRR